MNNNFNMNMHMGGPVSPPKKSNILGNIISESPLLVIIIVAILFGILLISSMKSPSLDYLIGMQIYNSEGEMIYNSGSSYNSYDYIGNTNIIKIELCDGYDDTYNIWYYSYKEIDVTNCTIILNGKRIR